MGAEIKPCACKNEYQDKHYGKNLRVMSVTTKGYRCTVCGKETVATNTKKK